MSDHHDILPTWRSLTIKARIDLPGHDLHGEDVLVQEIDTDGIATVARASDVGRRNPFPLHSISVFDLVRAE